VPLAQPKPLLPPPVQPPTRRNRPIEIPKPTTLPQSLVEPIFDESHKKLQHEVLDISLRMYDYAQLERWQRRVDQLCRQHGVRVRDSIAYPCRSFTATLFKPQTTQPSDVHALREYERIVPIANVTGPPLQLLIESITAEMPSGAKLSVELTSAEKHNNRYLPNLELMQLQEELKSYDDVNVRRKKGWIAD